MTEEQLRLITDAYDFKYLLEVNDIEPWVGLRVLEQEGLVDLSEFLYEDVEEE